MNEMYWNNPELKGYSLLGNSAPSPEPNLGYQIPDWMNGDINSLRQIDAGNSSFNLNDPNISANLPEQKPEGGKKSSAYNAKMDAMIKALAGLLGGDKGALPWAYAASVGTKTPFALQDPYKGKGANFRSLLGRYLAGG